jgi:5-methyltetrahydropteroyltriglutamate--homocysteine methyltransferase
MITTTTIGAYPKPSYVPIADWFTKPDGDYTGAYLDELAAAGDQAEALFERATREVVSDQIDAGIDIPTDGEVRRENYIHYLCRHLSGFSFKALATRTISGTTEARLPTIVGPVGAGETPIVRDYIKAQAATDRPVKMTLPGPMTIIDSTVDYYYRDEAELGRALSQAINVHVRALAEAGCRHIQLDDPMMMRRPDVALRYGIDQLVACFSGVDDEVTRIAHACCGYPRHLDDPDYEKAPRESYLDLARALDRAPIDAVSLEDAHRHNDLETLLPRFANTTVILGVVAIARSRIETIEEIVGRLKAARAYLPADQLVAAPDCGLGYLSRNLAMAKLQALTDAAAMVT